MRKVGRRIKAGITYLAWIKPQKRSAPIFKFSVLFGINRRARLVAEFTPSRGRGRKPKVISRRPVRLNKWQFVGVTYNQRSRKAVLYINNRPVGTKRLLRRVRLARTWPAVIGVSGRKTYRGQISCLHVYNVALSPRQIARRRKRCFKGARYNI